MPSAYTIVQLKNGSYSVHSLAHGETCHPVVGPAAEAESLYVNQLKLAQRLSEHERPFVIWDVGLGPAANPVTILRGTSAIPGSIHMISFDSTLEPLGFALQHSDRLAYLHGYEARIKELLEIGRCEFNNQAQHVTWEVLVDDFPSLVAKPEARQLPRPHAILFDAYSPAKNPAMWTAPLFSKIFQLLDPACPCALATYSRSTMLRVTFLLAGFFVGVGRGTGEKEETTVAANTLELLDEPLTRAWLARVATSTSAEPLWEPVYRQKPISNESFERLQQHPQFATLSVHDRT